MMESSEETDHANEDYAGIDLEVRIRRFHEETVSLRDDLTRAEDTISTLERDIKSTQKALYVFLWLKKSIFDAVE